MTVKELIEELKKFPEDLVVVYSTQEDTYGPSPMIERFSFDSSYYTGIEFVKLPANVPFVVL